MLKKIILFILLIWLGFISNTAKAQSLQWAYNLNAYVNCIEIDENGNVLIAGNFEGTVDFNLSPSGVTNLTSSGKLDAFFAKYTPTGNLIYARKFGSRLTEEITDAKIDNSGNIFFTGTFSDTVDFDPGVGIFQMISAPTVTQGSYSYTDIFITKFSSNGSFLWAKKIGNAFDDKIFSCALDSNNNIYSVGYTGGIVDFDPGPGIYSFNTLKTQQAYILKLDSNGNFVWVKQLPSSLHSYARAISISPDNMLNVTGTFSDTTVFDSSTLISYATGIYDIFVCKINSNGAFRWLKQIGSTNPKNLRRLTTDQYGTIAMAGFLTGTCDFDPGPGIANLIAQSYDGLICKFDSSGNYISANLIGSNSTGSLFTENCYDISYDSNSNLYVTGNFMGTADFDFGPVNYMMSADTSNLGDSYISKYDSSGEFYVGIQT
ncbi:MAG: hypothetical protein IPP32_08420 [Bacteroidetes bacterium]|nr:hypothetical protein [Bacteroidota bacterium]